MKLIYLACLAASLCGAPQWSVPERWKPLRVTGQDGVVFSFYGAPASTAALEELVAVLQREGLANGFDPAPSPYPESAEAYRYLAKLGWPVVTLPPRYGEFQIAGGRSSLGDEHEALLQQLDHKGIFNALQLGEWGYYFHELSHQESWWKSVYGEEYESFRHLMKPTSMRGFDPLPQSRKEAYDQVRAYYLERQAAQRGRIMSVTGHSHYECYAAEWGTRMIGIEVGENIAFTQSKLAFTRGAARQWGLPFSVQVSPWFGMSCTTAGPVVVGEDKIARGTDAGHSLSLYRRMWLHAWFAGAAMITPENSAGIWFEPGEPKYQLTPHARAAQEVFRFMCQHDAGTPYTPVAIVIDRYAGYNAFQGRPWGILPVERGDEELSCLLEHQLFPGADHRHEQVAPEELESRYLRPTPYGEMCDVILSTATGDCLSTYPVLLLAGEHSLEPGFVEQLMGALRNGSKLLMQQRHATALGEGLAALRQCGEVEVLAPSQQPGTGKPEAISCSRLRQLTEDLLPLRVKGEGIQYQVNRHPNGWVVELVNNNGVVKLPDRAQVLDAEAAITVRLETYFPCHRAKEWWTGQEWLGAPLEVVVPAGESRFVQLSSS